MASGGPRAHSGPPPDPTALSRDRKGDKATWVTLPGPRTEPAPAWPLAIPASPAEQLHWTREWARPQAHQWLAQGQEVEVAMYVRVLAEAEIPGAAANARGEARQRSEYLGLSLPGLARLRWVMPSSTTTPAATATQGPAARPSGTRPSARDRIVRVVPPPSED